MLTKFVRILGGDPNKKEIDRHTIVVDKINALEPQFEALSDEALSGKTLEFRRRLAQGENLDDLMPEAFAAAREASKRTLGLRHYDVQLLGGMVLHRGAIAEMRTGEGKTLVATLPLYLNALALNPAWRALAEKKWGSDPARWDFVPLDDLPIGRSAHLVTVNDYLARRDARWMAPVYNLLGLSVGVLQMATRTENGKNAFIVDLEKSSPHEDQNQLRLVDRAEAYAADIVYGTNSEFGFDYLRDNLAMRLKDRVQRGHYYAIVDEVDNVLIDEARTPLIISSPASENIEWYVRMAQVVKALRSEDYEINEKDHTATLTEIGETHVEEILGIPLRDPERPEDVTPEQARLLGYLEQAMRAQFLFHRNKDYLVTGGKVVIVDEFTGRQMPGRRWSDGLHQAVEAKEGARVQAENVTSATITIQNYFRMYEKLAGMTGTAATEAEEFSKIYDLDVIVVPTNLDYQASKAGAELVMLEKKDESGYKYIYFARHDDPEEKPYLWKRKDYPDVVYRTEDAKLRAVVREILQMHVLGRPVLVGTTSVELSEHVSSRLGSELLTRLMLVLLLRQTWYDRQGQPESDGFQVPELLFLNEPLEKLQIPEMRKLGRELGISLNPEDPANLPNLLRLIDLQTKDEQVAAERLERMRADLRGGIPHQVLNARKHTEESQIIAGAGAFGAVTIATNMAGRGVDIKLGGEISEGVLADVNRVLEKAGFENPYEMSLDERRTALGNMNAEDFGIYEAQIQEFLNYMENMERVKTLGGLHVVGSERHESRRIDNQLRGRAARQGDPGSSRFFLSMQDELMRLFGGSQVDNLMQRLKIDDSIPLEHGLVGRHIENSQTRVEGMHFDTRKHLLEYDDVLNSQRARIYAQRDLIFTKTDLSEDVTEMLSEEVRRRVPEALLDDEGPWRLLSWLEQVQPAVVLAVNNLHFAMPSYTLKVTLDAYFPDTLPKPQAKTALEEIARKALDAEEQHLMNGVQRILLASREHYEDALEERLDTLRTFLDGIDEREEEAGAPSARQIAEELVNTLRLPLKLTSAQQRTLQDAAGGDLSKRSPEFAELRQDLAEQIQTGLMTQSVKRLIGAVGRRAEEMPGIQADALANEDWDTVSQKLLDGVELLFANRRQQFFEDATLAVVKRDLERIVDSLQGDEVTNAQAYTILEQVTQGTRTAFDRRTHKKVALRTTRLSYFYHAAHLLEGRETREVTEDVLEHLKNSRLQMQAAWGWSEINRLAGQAPAALTDTAQAGLRDAVGDEAYEAMRTHPFSELRGDGVQTVVMELGRQALTEAYRDLLLRVISWEWIEYLTQMEALRVSIGLEAYGQRDPLVQYKAKASELFQGLMANIRLGVVNAMFTSLRRGITGAQVAAGEEPALTGAPAAADGDEEESAPESAAVAQTDAAKPAQSGGSKSSRRRRRRK